MSFENKNILLIGLAKTGVATLKFLHSKNAHITVYDSKTSEELEDILESLKDIPSIKYILGVDKLNISSEIDLAVVSPGVPLDIPVIEELREKNIQIIGDIELAYMYKPDISIIGITGTNGKTTTTSLVSKISTQVTKNSHLAGNIGTPIMDVVENLDQSSTVVAELSSFQLESINLFNPHVCAVLNLTPDHLNRHKTMENYLNAKANIFKNQTEKDFTVLNFDDKAVRELSDKTNGTVVFFSRKSLLLDGVCVAKNGDILINKDARSERVMNISEISLPGKHNLENVLAAIAICYCLNYDMDKVSMIIKKFNGVEHRQEVVKTVDGVTFVNDSKATNPDSAIKAIESYKEPVILIAGGMDKKGDFYELIDAINKNSVKALILLGETSPIIEKQALEKDFDKLIIKVHNMKDAVSVSKKIAKEGDVVLLSPACASWDMYSNFEERGLDFKNNI